MNIYWKPAIFFSVHQFCIAEAWESLANDLWLLAELCDMEWMAQAPELGTCVPNLDFSAHDLGVFLSTASLNMCFNMIKVSLHMASHLSFQHDKCSNHCSFQFPYWNKAEYYYAFKIFSMMCGP